MFEVKFLEKEIAGLSVVHSKNSTEEISEISLPANPKEGTLCLVKERSFLKKFEEAGVPSGVFLIVSKELFEKEKEKIESFYSNSSWVAVAENYDKMVCALSKLFYDKKFEGIQNLVDGRQLGNVDIHPSAEIAQNVFLGDHVKIEEGVKILSGTVISSHCHIKKNTVIYQNVSLYSFSEIGENCRIHAGCRIGGDGYGYNFFDGAHHKVWHHGGVIVESDVELGTNVTVDMGTFTPTKIGSGTKIDNLVQIAHNVILGKNVIVCGMSGIAGSATVGDFTMIGGAAALGPNCHLGAGCQVAGGAKINKSWPEKSIIGGYPARNLREWQRGLAKLKKLTEGK